MEQNKAHGNRNIALFASLLALFAAVVCLYPQSGRDFTLVLVAMAALGLMLFVWSRHYTGKAHPGCQCEMSDSDTPTCTPDDPQDLTQTATEVDALTDDDPAQTHIQDLGRISMISRIYSRVGHHAPLEDVRRCAVESFGEAYGCAMTCLYTIDPYSGAIECDSTDGVSEELKNAFLALYGDIVTDRECDEPHIQHGIQSATVQDEKALEVFARSGIQGFVACPIRSGTGVSGALVLFHPVEVQFPEVRRRALAIASEIVSTTLSFAAAIEQSGNLLDDLAGENHDLSVQATVDGLTGLANHRTLQQTLADMCRPSGARKPKVFSLLMLDADHFKIYNDTHGHRAGDAALREIAKLISTDLRQGDLAARYGGEEFAVILKDTGRDSALSIAERIRRRVAEAQLEKGSLTISLGIAEFPADGSTSAELIEHADRALYHAKVTGRNRVVVWGNAANAGTAAPESEEQGPRRRILVAAKASDNSTQIIRDALDSAVYIVEDCSSAEHAADVLRIKTFDLAIVGLEVLPEGDVKSLGSIASIHPDMPIVLLAEDPPLDFSRLALQHGATDVLSRPFAQDELPLVIERNIERRRLERNRLTEKSTSIMLQAIEALVAAIDAKDHYTAGHSRRVTALSLAIADDLSLSNEDRYALELAAKIHDIGKVALPDSALNKQSPLTEEEWLAMRDHPALGCKIVGAIDELAYVSAIIRHHHERLDGSGYPDGLKAEAIPYLSRIIAVADAYEAMTSERAYRGRLAPAEAVEELKSRSGSHYVPEIVHILEKKLKESGETSDTAQAA